MPVTGRYTPQARIVGVDEALLNDQFEGVLHTTLRAGCHVVVRAYSILSEHSMTYLSRVYSSGYAVSLVHHMEQAPEDTLWLTAPIP